MRIHEIKMYQEFDAPVEQVWEAFNDHGHFGRMTGQKIRRIVDSVDPANINGLGSVRHLSIPLSPCEETITRSEKPKVIEYKITRGTPLHHHYGWLQFKELPDGRSALDYKIELGSRLPLVGRIIKMALNKGLGRALKKYAARLKK